MYRLMLVDDESDVRDGLKEIIDWQAHGFEVVAEAEHGLEALQIAETVVPDLVVTDIRMPYMDGLEMARRMRLALPAVQFIVLSGFDDFPYAQRAIQLQVLDYVLKPIASDEFSAVLSQVKRKMDRQVAERNDVESLRSHVTRSLPLLRDKLLVSLLCEAMSEQECLERAQRYGMALDSPRYAVALFSADAHGQSHPLQGDDELLRFAMLNIAEEAHPSAPSQRFIFFCENRLALLLLLEPEEEAPFTAVSEQLEQLRGVMQHYLGVQMTIGLSLPCGALTGLRSAYQQALAALDHRITLGEGRVICLGDVEPGSQEATTPDSVMLRELSSALKTGRKAQFSPLLEQLLAPIQQKGMSFTDYELYVMEILLVIIRTARALQVTIEHVMPGQHDPLQHLLHPQSYEELRVSLTALCHNIARSIEAGRIASTQQIVTDAVHYLEAHFNQSDITVERLCRMLHISPAYFSTLFKRETNETFHQYLMRLRMEQAMALLRTTDLKSTEIAERIGIHEPSYFSYSFKRYFGLSPTQVRKDQAREA